jgi:hypothetical protein
MPRQHTWRGGVALWYLLLLSDWGNHAKTTYVARRSCLMISVALIRLGQPCQDDIRGEEELPYDICCSYQIGATMPRRQTLKIELLHDACCLHLSDWGNHVKTNRHGGEDHLVNNNRAVCNIKQSVGCSTRWSHTTVIKIQNLKFLFIPTNARWVPGACTHKHKDRTCLDTWQYAWVFVGY